MIKTRLIKLVKGSQKYIAETVVLQRLNLCSTTVTAFAIAHVLDELMRHHDISLETDGLLLLLAMLVKIASIKLAVTTSYKASRNVKRTIRGIIYQKLLRLGSSYSKHVSTAEIVELAGEGAEQLETYFGSYLPQFFYALLAPVTLFIVVSHISLTVASILLICVSLIPLSIAVVQSIAKRLLSAYWDQYATLGDRFLENLQGITTLKIYQADEQRHQAMNKDAERFRIVTMKVLIMQLNSVIVMDIIAYGGAALGILLATFELTAGSIDFFGCFVIILLSTNFFLPMRRLGSFFHVAMNSVAASDKIFGLLDLPEVQSGTEIPADHVIGISSVCFSYTDKQEVLRAVNIIFPENSFTALVGKSECGKSTIASILAGRNKGYAGHIMLGGKELSHVSEKDLVKHITLINHKSHIFKGTPRKNLSMGNPNVGEAQLWHVLEQVKSAHFLRQEGDLDTALTEGASNLSGGQRQRLALARALLHDSPIYIFDEATSAVDVESEQDIMELIHTLAHKKTAILISHRLANVVTSDVIYVLDAGRVVQFGKHEELLAQSGTYKTLRDTQQILENLARKPREENVLA